VKLLVCLFSVAVAGSVFAAPDEIALGRNEGYPVCKLTNAPAEERCLVGMLSHYDELVPARRIAHGAPRELRHEESAKVEADAFMAQNRNTGLMVIKDGVVLAERYGYDRKPTDRLQSYSMAKTVVAMLFGIALNEKKIGSIEDKAGQYVPSLKGHPYGETALKDLLTMSSGVRFSEIYNGKDDVTVLGRKTLAQQGPGGAEAVSTFTDRVRPAGTRFSYSSAETYVLGLVLSAATGKTLADYLSEKIWVPMGAEADASWLMDAGGHELAFMGINATLRDWGRFGVLLANYGAQDGKQIIPAGWVKEATRVHAPHLEVGVATQWNGYGYQTWLIRKGSPMFAAFGLRGQAVYVDPVSKLVIVHTAVSGVDGSERRAQFEYLYKTLSRVSSQ
jgi:CubicO group peptidase (beta-lactamase class C family)